MQKSEEGNYSDDHIGPTDISSPPPVPNDPEILKNIQILAQFVAKNGPSFEDLAKTKESSNPKFSFLFGGPPGSDAAIGHEYFEWLKKLPVPEQLQIQGRLSEDNDSSRTAEENLSEGFDKIESKGNEVAWTKHDGCSDGLEGNGTSDFVVKDSQMKVKEEDSVEKEHFFRNQQAALVNACAAEKNQETESHLGSKEAGHGNFLAAETDDAKMDIDMEDDITLPSNIAKSGREMESCVPVKDEDQTISNNDNYGQSQNVSEQKDSSNLKDWSVTSRDSCNGKDGTKNENFSPVRPMTEIHHTATDDKLYSGNEGKADPMICLPGNNRLEKEGQEVLYDEKAGSQDLISPDAGMGSVRSARKRSRFDIVHEDTKKRDKETSNTLENNSKNEKRNNAIFEEKSVSINSAIFLGMTKTDAYLSLKADSVRAVSPSHVKQEERQLKVDEFGRLIREVNSESESDSYPRDGRGNMDHSRSRSPSPRHDRSMKRSYSPSPRWRSRWSSRSRSRSPKRRRSRSGSWSRSRSITPLQEGRRGDLRGYGVARGMDTTPVCQNYLRGKCFREVCKFLHSQPSVESGSKWGNEQRGRGGFDNREGSQRYMHGKQNSPQSEFEHSMNPAHDRFNRNKPNFHGDRRFTEQHGRSNFLPPNCIDFQRGRCNKGSTCKYLHTETVTGSRIAPPRLDRERTDNRQGVSKAFGGMQKFSSSESNTNTFPEERPRESHFSRSSSENRGIDYGRGDIRSKPLCRFFASGSCNYGSTCKYRHEDVQNENELWKKESTDSSQFSKESISERHGGWEQSERSSSAIPEASHGTQKRIDRQKDNWFAEKRGGWDKSEVGSSLIAEPPHAPQKGFDRQKEWTSEKRSGWDQVERSSAVIAEPPFASQKGIDRQKDNWNSWNEQERHNSPSFGKTRFVAGGSEMFQRKEHQQVDQQNFEASPFDGAIKKQQQVVQSCYNAALPNTVPTTSDAKTQSGIKYFTNVPGHTLTPPPALIPRPQDIETCLFTNAINAPGSANTWPNVPGHGSHSTQRNLEKLTVLSTQRDMATITNASAYGPNMVTGIPPMSYPEGEFKSNMNVSLQSNSSLAKPPVTRPVSEGSYVVNQQGGCAPNSTLNPQLDPGKSVPHTSEAKSIAYNQGVLGANMNSQPQTSFVNNSNTGFPVKPTNTCAMAPAIKTEQVEATKSNQLNIPSNRNIALQSGKVADDKFSYLAPDNNLQAKSLQFEDNSNSHLVSAARSTHVDRLFSLPNTQQTQIPQFPPIQIHLSTAEAPLNLNNITRVEEFVNAANLLKNSINTQKLYEAATSLDKRPDVLESQAKKDASTNSTSLPENGTPSAKDGQIQSSNTRRVFNNEEEVAVPLQQFNASHELKASEIQGGTNAVAAASKQELIDCSSGQTAETGVIHVNTESGQAEPLAESKQEREMKALRFFRTALAEFVKEQLKPTWHEGHLSKEAFKTIVKKVVDKVSGSVQSHQIPKSQERFDQYIAVSKPKLSKLIQGYVEKYVEK